MITSILVSLFVVATGHSETASSCKKFSVIEDGQSMANVPARDQGDVATCYAMGSASAIDAWRLSNDPSSVKFLTSPHALAVDTQKSFSKQRTKDKMYSVQGSQSATPIDYSFGGSSLKDSVSAAKKYGICDYAAFGANFESKEQVNERLFWSNLTDAYKKYHEQLVDALLDSDADSQPKIMQNALEDVRYNICRSNLPVDANQLVDLKLIADFVKAKTPQDALQKITSKVCAGHTDTLPKDFPDPVQFGSQQLPTGFQDIVSRSTVYRKVIDAMARFKNKQPILIAYCSGVIHNFNSVGVDPVTGKPTACTGHVSVIVGRERTSDGRCGYWIRNSTGTDRDDAHGVVGQMDDRGDILVPEEALFNNIMEVSVLPPRGEKYVPPKDVYKREAVPAPGAMYSGGAGAYPVVNSYQTMPPVQPQQFIAPTQNVQAPQLDMPAEPDETVEEPAKAEKKSGVKK